jgi:hypothetical protein
MDDETEITLGNIELMREELEMEELEQKWQWELNDWLEDAMFDREEYKHRWDTRHEFLESLKEKANGN